MSSRYAVIMAGGSGTRFWPASRSYKPKQLLPLGGRPDESLVCATVRRLTPLFKESQILVATGEQLHPATVNALSGYPGLRFLIEPIARNTAACIGWATATCARTDPHALIAVLPSDHVIANDEQFREVVERAFQAASKGYLTTVGIVPTRPETGYGYIETGEIITAGIFEGRRFVEKPNAKVAEEYVRGGKHLWNAGMFFFRASTMMKAIERYLPDLAAGLAQLEDAAATGREEEALRRVFPLLPSISIDQGIMEQASNVAVVPGDFGWSDIGSWQSAWELAPHDAQGNALPEGTIAIDATGNLVSDRNTSNRRKRVALVGVHDLIVVDTDDALLIIPRDRSQDVRAVVDALVDRDDTSYL